MQAHDLNLYSICCKKFTKFYLKPKMAVLLGNLVVVAMTTIFKWPEFTMFICPAKEADIDRENKQAASRLNSNKNSALNTV